MPELRAYLLLAGLLPSLASNATDAETLALQINPFLRPILEAVSPGSATTAESKIQADSMQLRGTMLAGSNSVANIDGLIIGIGQHIQDYTLIAVEQRHVVLERNGTHTILSIDDETGRND